MLNRLGDYLENNSVSDEMFECLKTEYFEIIIENFCVNYLFCHYHVGYSQKNPMKPVTDLLYVLNIIKCLMLPIADSREKFNVSEIAAIISIISRFFEHSNNSIPLLNEIYDKEYGHTRAFLLSLI